MFFLVDGRAGLTSVDQSIAVRLRKISKPIYLVVNKTDGLDEEIASADFQSLGFAEVYSISACNPC